MCRLNRNILFAAILWAILGISAQAATSFTWVGGGSGNWSDASQWSPNGNPGSSDSVTFTATNPGTNNPCSINAAVSVAGLTIASDYGGTLTQGSGNAITVGASGFSQAGGTFTGGASGITLNGSFALSGGMFNAGSQIIAPPYGISNNWSWTVSGGTFNAQTSTVVFTGASITISVSGSQTLNNVIIGDYVAGTGNIYLNDSDTLTVMGTLAFVDTDGGWGGAIINSGVIAAQGDVVFADGNDYGQGNALLLINGSGNQTITGGGGYIPNLQIASTGGAVTLAGNIATYNDWTYTSGTLNPTGTVIFEGPPNRSLIVTGSHTLNNVVFGCAASGTGNFTVNLSIGTALTATGTLTFQDLLNGPGGATINNGTIAAKGDVVFADGNDYGQGSALLLINGSGNQTITGNYGRIPKLQIASTGGTVTLAGNIATYNDWTYTSGTLNPTGTVIFEGPPNGSLTVTGSHTLNNVVFGCCASGSGDFTVNLSDGTAMTATGTLTFQDLLNGSGGVIINNGALVANGNVVVADANSYRGATSFQIAGAANQSFTDNGIASSFQFAPFTVNKTGGALAFTTGFAYNGTVSFAPGTQATFAHGQTFAFGTLAWQGLPSNPIVLRSDLTGSQWNLNALQTYPLVSCVDVQDSNASGGSVIAAYGSTDSGNNLNWVFSPSAQVAISTPGSSITSPAWVEGISWPEVTSITVSVNSGTAFNAAILNPLDWYADNNASNNISSALGITLSSTAATTVLVSATDGTNTSTASQNITWTVTDLSGLNSNTNSVTIRQGDSLLFTDSGTGTTFTLDPTGGGVVYTGAPGTAYAYQYSTAGSYVATAKLYDQNNNLLATDTLTVTVLSVDLGQTVLASMLNSATSRTATVTPVTAGNQVWLGSADAAHLTVTSSYAGSGVWNLSVTSLDQTNEPLLARVANGQGPVIAYKQVQAFTIQYITNTAAPDILTYPDGDSLAGICIQMAPYVAGVNLQSYIFSGGALFLDTGTTTLNFSSNNMDQNGQYNYYLIQPPTGNICNGVRVVE